MRNTANFTIPKATRRAVKEWAKVVGVEYRWWWSTERIRQAVLKEF